MKIILNFIIITFFISCGVKISPDSDLYQSKGIVIENEYRLGSRKLKYIVGHCTASLPKKNGEPQSIEFFEKIWKNNGWNNVGYSYLVRRDGTIWIWKYHKFDEYIEGFERTNGVYGFNQVSVHIAYEGGIDKNLNPIDNMTTEQERNMRWLIERHLEFAPDAEIVGHRDIQINSNKACPSFDMKVKFNDICK